MATRRAPHQRVSPLLGARRFARWRASMVGWKPLLRQGDAHTVSPNVRSHLHLSTRPSKSLQVPPAFRSSASKPGTPRNRLHSAALPANQIAHSRDPRARLSPILSDHPRRPPTLRSPLSHRCAIGEICSEGRRIGRCIVVGRRKARKREKQRSEGIERKEDRVEEGLVGWRVKVERC